MPKLARRLRVFIFLIGVALSVFSGWASADPPSRIARLGYVSGAVSFSPSGENDWARATLNRPLTTGDRLWADARGRAEVQIGGAIVRMNAGTGLSVLNLDDQIVQLQLTQGTLNVRVRRLDRNQVFEIDTPNLALIVRKPGEYRIAVDLDGDATTVVVRKGQAEVYGDAASYVLDARQPYRFTGTDLREYEYVDAPRPDEFDRWASGRDRVYDNSPSARYVSSDVIGYQDLDANGRWRVDATYGNVWVPNRVAAGWAPYRDGHWAWVDPWGWTWVDDAPWGFAVSHYGRWANMQGTWGWVPGPVNTRAYYAPALVVFVGGANFQLAFSSGTAGAVAWFPLAPREVYRPSYVVSRGYFENVNRSNTVVNTTVINNYYNNTNVTNIVYVNRAVPGAVVAVPTTAFVQAQPVSRAALSGVVPAMLAQRPVVAAPPVAPVERSVRGAAPQADKPPARAFERPVVAHAAPPAAHVGFAAQQAQLAAKPGIPLEDAVRKQLKPVESAPAPAVKVIAQTPKAPPTVQPPPPVVATKRDAADRKPVERPSVAAPVMPVAPAAPAAPAAAKPAEPAAAPTTQRGNAEQRGGAESRRPAVVEPKVAAPQPTLPPQATPVAQPRGDSQQRGRADPPGQGSPPAQRAAEPKDVAPPVAAPQPAPPPPTAPAVQPRVDPQQRGRADRPERAVPPAPREAEPKVVAPPQAVAPAPAPAAVPAPQRPARPDAERPSNAASPASAAPQPAATPAAPRARETAPKETPPQRDAAPKQAPPQRDAAPGAQQRAERPRPAASEPEDKKDNVDERKGGKGKP